MYSMIITVLRSIDSKQIQLLDSIQAHLFQLKKQQQLQQQILHEQFQAQKQQLEQQHEHQLRQHLKVCSRSSLNANWFWYTLLSTEFKPAP